MYLHDIVSKKSQPLLTRYLCNANFLSFFNFLGFCGFVPGGTLPFSIFSCSFRALSSRLSFSSNSTFSTTFNLRGTNPSPALLHPISLSFLTVSSVRPLCHNHTAFFCSKSRIPVLNLANCDQSGAFLFQSAPARYRNMRMTGRLL